MLAVSLSLMLVAGWLTNVPALLLGRIVDLVSNGRTSRLAEIMPQMLLISGAILFREIAIWFRKFIVERAATELERDEFVRLIAKLLSLNPSFMVRERTGALNVRIHRSVEGIVKLLKLQFLEFMPAIVSGAVAIAFAATKQWFIAFLMLVIATLGALVTWWQIRSQMGIRVELFRAKEALGGKVTELLWGIEYVRAGGLQEHETELSRKLAQELQRKEFKHHRWMMSFDAAKQIIEGAGFVAVIGCSAWMAANGVLTKGDVLTLAVLYGSVAAPIRELHRIVDEGFESVLKVGELESIIALPSDSMLCGISEPNENNPLTVCTEGLSVTYERPDGTLHQALTNVTVLIRKGESIGIAGESGSGKSTFVKAVLGLISRYSGSIDVFGVSVRDLNKDSLASLTAYVSQRPFLFHGTVRENIIYGVTSPKTETELWTALERAHIKDLIESLPGQLDAPLAEQGRNLSGGEQQRIVLARVFLKGAGLLILDEATAALDNENERLVQHAIEEIATNQTTITIAHRLSTLRGLDRILVFEGGQIVQDGNYESLASSSGIFKRLLEERARDDMRSHGSPGRQG